MVKNSKMLIMTKGLPASGKSTWAKELLKNNPQFKRINKDDLRAMIDNSQWSKENEKMIVESRDSLVSLFLSQGFSVVVDDTGFDESHAIVLEALATQHNATFSINDSFLDVPVSVCIERDSLRLKPVGRDVILKMANKHVKYRNNKIDCVRHANKPYVVVCDLDGTIAHHVGRSPYEFHKCDTDAPINYVIETVCALSKAMDCKIIFLSGREDSCRDKTYGWLLNRALIYRPFELIMRKTGDHRKDSVVKGELMTQLMGAYSIFAVFDDREQVVQEWNKMGLPVFDCSNGRGKF